LKLVSKCWKLNKVTIYGANIEEFVFNHGLLPLCNINDMVEDRGLLAAFVERWHREKSSFHLLIGEMTITLDDVSALLHLPIVGQFCPLVQLEFAPAIRLLVELLGVEESKTIAEMRKCHEQ